jgi:hypothetical protein
VSDFVHFHLHIPVGFYEELIRSLERAAAPDCAVPRDFLHGVSDLRQQPLELGKDEVFAANAALGAMWIESCKAPPTEPPFLGTEARQTPLSDVVDDARSRFAAWQQATAGHSLALLNGGDPDALGVLVAACAPHRNFGLVVRHVSEPPGKVECDVAAEANLVLRHNL